MRVEIEKRNLDSYRRIARDANSAAKSFPAANHGKYERLLEQRNLSAEKKKEKLAKGLHELIIKSFSVNINNKKSRKKAASKIRASTELIRSMLKKLEGINNYLEESLLREIGIIKKSLVLEATKSRDPVRYLEQKRGMLPKQYAGQIEHIVYELMQKIIFFDKRIIKDYKKKEVRIVGNEKLEAKSLQKVLMIQTELLEALEAKMPPASKIKQKLFTRNVFNYWAPMVFALLSSFETEYTKEKEIFALIKRNNKLRKKIEAKIKHVVAEKEKMLRIRHERAMLMSSLKDLGEDYRQAFHDYVAASNL